MEESQNNRHHTRQRRDTRVEKIQTIIQNIYDANLFDLDERDFFKKVHKMDLP